MPLAKSLTVGVLKVSGLRGVRGDSLTLLVRVELGDAVLGESGKIECNSGQAEPNLNVTIERPVGQHGAAWLDSLLSRPLVISFMEVLAKDKRGSREDKTQMLGQSCVDLLSVVSQPGSAQSVSVPVLPISAESPLTAQTADQPSCAVEVRADDPLMEPSWEGGSNILRVRIDSLHSLPEPWTSGSTAQYSYCAVLPVPVDANEIQTIHFPGGLLKQSDKTAKKPHFRTWSNPNPAVGPCTQLADSEITKVPYEEEDGELKSPQDEERRRVAEEQKQSIVWHAERRCFLSPNALQMFASQLRKHNLWPVEIVRVQQIQAVAKAKRLSALSEEPPERELSFHGVAYVDLAGLLYPGVHSIRGAYTIIPFVENDVTERTGQKGRARAVLQSTAHTGERLKSAVGKKTVRSPSSHKLSQVETAGNAEGEASSVLSEAKIYEESQSYIRLEFSLDSPLIAKRSPTALAQQVAEYIPPRPAMPQHTGSAEQAVALLQKHFNDVASAVIDNLTKCLRNKSLNGTSQAPELLLSEVERAGRELITKELKPSGKYNAFREQLRHATVQVVREKFQHVTAFSDRAALEDFLPKLYSFLVSELHKCLHKRQTEHNPVPHAQSPATTAQLLLFANEAESEGDFSLADNFYRKCIAVDGSAAHWLAYAKFSLLCGDSQRAEECLKEAISTDQRCFQSLLLYALVSAQHGRDDVAELFFERACSEQNNVVAITLMGLFYDMSGNVIGKERTLREAVHQHKEAIIGPAEDEVPDSEQMPVQDGTETDGAMDADGASTSENQLESAGHEETTYPAVDITVAPASPQQASSPTPPAEGQTLHQDTNASVLATSEDQGMQKNGDILAEQGAAAGESQVSLAQASSTESQTSLNQSGHPLSPTVLQQSSTLLTTSGATGPSQLAHNGGANQTDQATPSIFYQAADFALSCHVLPIAELALQHERLAHGLSQSYYILKAQLHLQRKQFEQAKDCLQEALVCSYDNPCVWALYGHIHYLCGERHNAMSAYKRTLELPRNTSERHLVQLRLGNIYLEEQLYAEAKQVFLSASRELPSVRSWLGVGMACYRLGEIDEAQAALSEANLLYNTEPHVWAYLSLICLRKGQQREAEETFKYTIKTGLSDHRLLQELNALQLEVGFGDPGRL